MALSVKVAVICAVASLVGACGGQVASPSPSPGPSGTPGASNRPSQTPTASFDPTKSAWQNVLARVGPNGEVDPQLALDAFVLAIGPLPGVARPPGDAGPIYDGTFAVNAIRRNWASLTAEQQQAAERLIRGSLPSAQVAPRALALVGSAGGLGGGQVQDDATQGWQTLAEQAAAAIAAHLQPQRSLKATIDVQLNAAPPAGESPQTWDSWAYTWAEDAEGLSDGPMATCHVFINPQGQGATAAYRYELAAHEVFHCYQFDLGTIAAHDNVADWVTEGSAEWAGEDIAGGTNLSIGWWEEWLTTPLLPLFARTYDAIGVYALLDDAGVNPWSVMDKFLLASINGNEAAYGVLRTSGGDAFIDSWGPRYAMAQANGTNWAFAGAGLLPGLDHFSAPAVTASAGASVQLPAGAYAALQFDVVLQSDVVAFDSSTTHGLAQVQPGQDQQLGALVAHPLCTKSSCSCPAGTAGVGVSFQAATAGSVVQVGFAGDDGGAVVQVTGLSLDDFCNQAHVDPCLVGRWVSTGATAPDHDIIGGDGIILTIGADGSVTEDYDLMNALLVTPTVQPVPEVAFSVELQWFGTASGHIRAEGGTWLLLDSNVDSQRWSLSVFLNGHETKVFDHATAAEVGPGGGTGGLGGQTGDQQLGGIGGLGGLGDGIYVCGEGTLLIKPNSALGALNWLKQ